MKALMVCTLVLLTLALFVPGAKAQGNVLFQSQEGGGQFLLAPQDTQAPLFLENRGEPAAPVGGSARVQTGAIAWGTTVAGPGVLPAIFPADLQVNIGFEYLRPDFPGRSVRLAIPNGINGNFSSIAGSGDVSYDFGFVPKMSAEYAFEDLGFGMAASGELTSLSGHLTRTIDSAGGSANLTANGTVNFAVANLLEGTKYIRLDRFPRFEDTWLEDTALLVTLGTRYSHLAQDFSATLSSGANTSTLTAHQDWDGFGVTTSFSFLHPLCDNFFLYGVSRGSFMVGTNNRNSTATVVVVANPAANSSTKLTENKTELIPVGEFEAGVAWGTVLARKRAQTAAPSQAAQSAPILWVKLGLVADLWGSLGLLSAPDNLQGFSDGRLLLYGFSVIAGLQF